MSSQSLETTILALRQLADESAGAGARRLYGPVARRARPRSVGPAGTTDGAPGAVAGAAARMP